MSDYPKDIYTEPDNPDVDTLGNLGPLAALAGVWEGTRGLDTSPKADGPEKRAFVERIELQPIDPQMNGPQLLYGLRYHTHITKPNEVETFHSQVGYWLWEPATEMIVHTLTIPRGLVTMAVGHAAHDARAFEVRAKRGASDFCICSTPFLEHAFRTDEFHMKVTINDDDTWSYEETTLLTVRGRVEPFPHTDRNTLTRIAMPTPNPLARR